MYKEDGTETKEASEAKYIETGFLIKRQRENRKRKSN